MHWSPLRNVKQYVLMSPLWTFWELYIFFSSIYGKIRKAFPIKSLTQRATSQDLQCQKDVKSYKQIAIQISCLFCFLYSYSSYQSLHQCHHESMTKGAYKKKLHQYFSLQDIVSVVDQFGFKFYLFAICYLLL